jgi:hypothetical protein
MSSLRVLLEGAIDYAGLFPPASLPFEEVIRNYAAYRDSADAWALGRLIVPLERLPEVSDRSWPISLLTVPGEPIPAGLADAVEIRVTSANELLVPVGVTAYFEAPPELIPAIAAAGARAKIRMGGHTVPDSPTVADFMKRCARERIAFKATAGLHHPFRTESMHGFINTLVAACLIWHGADADIAVEVLEERHPDAFRFRDTELAWRDEALAVGKVAEARNHFIASFGSCSFEEPFTDLRDLGLL